jgi:hypothetical protein
MALMDKSVYSTGIGSVFHSNIEDGFEFSLKHDIPFLPQFYKLEGSMIDIANTVSYPYLDKFIDILESKKKEVIKLQLVGPNSSKLSLTKLKKNIDYLSSRTTNFKTILFIGEPILSFNSNLEAIISHAKVKFSQVGLHSCSAEINYEEVNKLPIDIFSYDCFLNSKLHNLIREDICLCYGLLDAEKKLAHIVNNRSKSYISTTCGLGLSDINTDYYFQLLDKGKKSLTKMH